uniref:Uncharacterized protein n=1 Tax=Sphaerodactylus townsendi TaxID=933632 RepID=A0ACB8GB05_9SAUR
MLLWFSYLVIPSHALEMFLTFLKAALLSPPCGKNKVWQFTPTEQTMEALNYISKKHYSRTGEDYALIHNTNLKQLQALLILTITFQLKFALNKGGQSFAYQPYVQKASTRNVSYMIK